MISGSSPHYGLSFSLQNLLDEYLQHKFQHDLFDAWF